MSILRLGHLLTVSEFENYIEEAEKLSEHIHHYGTDFTGVFDYPCWLTYKDEGGIKGTISYTRHTMHHPVLSHMVTKLCTIAEKIMPPSLIKILPERFHILRTIGSIAPHRDEAGRMACINIGLKNASGAVTYTSIGQTLDTFNNNRSSTILEEGVAYLLDTQEVHSVEHVNDSPRYLITYGFGETFDYLKNIIKPIE